MTIVSSTSSTPAAGSAVASQDSLIADYELFLSILTTQIQNQDPLDPLDSSEFTNQLVQYSSVEQSIKQNQNLEEMISLIKSDQSLGYVSYIGNEITADASTTTLSGSQASWAYEIDEAASGTFQIRNSSGEVVYSGDAQFEAGSGTFTWEGQTDVGQNAPDGLYTISFDMKDANSRPEPVRTNVTGIVDSVDWSNGDIVLSVDGQDFPVSAVTAVSRPS